MRHEGLGSRKLENAGDPKASPDQGKKIGLVCSHGGHLSEMPFLQ